MENEKPAADAGDVLGKADALLRRHSIAPPASGSETGGVPVLTDLVAEAPAARESAPAPREEPAPVETAALGEPSSESPRTPADEALARELVASVMAQVEGRIAADLERRVAEYLVPEVRTAIAAALADLRPEIAQAIGEAIAGALESHK